MMTTTATAGRPAANHLVSAVRRFNRFYTQRIGALDEGHLTSPFSLAAVRVLYELAHRDPPTAAEIARDLQLDPGYLSRLVRALEGQGLVERLPSPTDGREQMVRLTESGQATFSDLDGRARADVALLLSPLTAEAAGAVAGAMTTIESLLGSPPPSPSVLLRPPAPGDLGWVVQRNGALYAAEYGWDQTYEGLVARIVSDFIDQLDPARDACWIAERGGENVGSVFVVHHPERDGVAKLRLLLVDPAARGLGIGRRLVDECVRFAGRAGYRALTLWTNSNLDAARRIYQAVGFRLVREEPHHSFGHDLVGQTWDLPLEASPAPPTRPADRETDPRSVPHLG